MNLNTKALTQFADIAVGEEDSFPNVFVQVGHQVFFDSWDADGHEEVYVTTLGSTEQPLRLTDGAGFWGTYPREKTVVGSDVYFHGEPSTLYGRLFKLDTMDLSVVELPEPASGTNSEPVNLEAYNGDLYFLARRSLDDHYCGAVYRLNPSDDVPHIVVQDIQVSYSRISFEFDESDLFVLGTTCGASGSEPIKYGVYDPFGGPVFEITDSALLAGSRLHSVRLRDTAIMTFANALEADYGYKSYLIDLFDGSKTELSHHTYLDDQYKYDRTTATFGELMAFMAGDYQSGYELWLSDGTVQGTFSVDIHPGPGSSYPDWFTPVGDMLYFSAYHPDYGRELWQSDGTVSGTELVSDIDPGPHSSFPTELSVADGMLFFSAFSSSSGRELWALRLGMLRAPAVGGANP